MNNQEIKDFIREEVAREISSMGSSMSVNKNPALYQSGNPQILPHKHDSISSPQILSSEIVYFPPIIGLISMTEANTYTLYLNNKNGSNNRGLYPRQVQCNAVATYNSAADGSYARSISVGTAHFGDVFHFQPDTSSSVKVKKQYVENVVQGSVSHSLTSTVVTGSRSATPANWSSEEYIINIYTVNNSGTAQNVARAYIPSSSITQATTAQKSNAVTDLQIKIVVDVLATGWEIDAVFTVT